MNDCNVARELVGAGTAWNTVLSMIQSGVPIDGLRSLARSNAEALFQAAAEECGFCASNPAKEHVR